MICYFFVALILLLYEYVCKCGFWVFIDFGLLVIVLIAVFVCCGDFWCSDRSIFLCT